MSDSFDFNFDDDTDDDQAQQPPSPRDLRNIAKKAKAEAAERAKENAELKERLVKYEREAKTASLSTLFGEAGVDPHFAKYAEADGTDSSKEAVEAWLKANPHIPVKTKGTTEKAPEGEPKPEPEKVMFQGVEVEPETERELSSGSLDPNMLAFLEAEGHLGNIGTSPSGRTPMQELAAMDLSKFTDYDDMIKAVNAKLAVR